MYHVMSRGDRRERIFLDDVDRQDFIKTLAEACQKTNWQVHAYCLMPNHYHLVLETREPNLVAGMAWLQSTYTIRLNHRHQLFGHVLSGRYTNSRSSMPILASRPRYSLTNSARLRWSMAFDDIGNRTAARAGGGQTGVNLHPATYSANNLNQYTSRTVPSYASSLGTANASAKVTLWADGGAYTLATRQTNYFWTELPVDNTSHALWVTLTNLAALNNGSNTDKVAKTIGHQFLAHTPEQFTYDADGTSPGTGGGNTLGMPRIGWLR